MNLLDENFPADQAAQLKEWRLPHRQIGRDISRYGIQDSNIIPLLHGLKRVTLFTQDQDFFNQRLCHSVYCLVWLEVKPGEAAFYLRRFLRHPKFDTQARRMGLVVRTNAEGVQCLRRGATQKIFVPWPD